MTHKTVHPETGKRYRMLFPWPTDIYCDWRSAYARLAPERPWIIHHGEEELGRLLSEAGPEDVLICWHDLLKSQKIENHETKAALILYWPETVGTGIGMTAYQLGMLRELAAKRALLYRGIVTYDPDSAKFLASLVQRPVQYAPAGYDAEVMGLPDWTVQKTADLAVYGAYTGIREEIMPDLRVMLGPKLDEFSGVHGKARASRLSRARGILLVPHSPGSFPQWRLWHAVASSAALLAPWETAWPAMSSDYVSLPFPEPARPAIFLDAVHRALARTDLAEIARRAHEHLSKITVAQAFDQWMMPAVTEILR